MGGLVIKQAYILAHEIPEFECLKRRIAAMFFLGTPHQGADIAQTLQRLLSLTGSRPFLNDLLPHSPTIQAINEEFPRVSQELKLFSFFETKAMNYGIGKGLIVERHSAVLNYPNERRTYLDANHRDIARYSSRNNPSYLTVRNALAIVVEKERSNTTESRSQLADQRREDLCDFLRIQDAPEDDLMVHNSVRLPGSCEWLFQKESFLEWQNSICSKICWLLGRPGVGKSVMSSYIITRFQGLNRDCSYFFFTRGDKNKDNINCFLRSMAFQMAILHPDILQAIMKLASEPVWKEFSIDKIDYSPIWRKIFLTGILKIRLQRPQYWIIDSIEECRGGDEILSLLARVQEVWSLCILITSRRPMDTFQSGNTPMMDVITQTISNEDSNADISLFLRSNITALHSSADGRDALISEILEKANGCFLWAYLLQRELRLIHTAAGIRRVLAAIPADMDELYQQILQQMADSPQNKTLTEVILLWTVCALRPLTTEELRMAIQIDMEDEVLDIERLIEACCGNLVFVDGLKRVQLVHLTIRDLLTSKTLQSDFRVDLSLGHQRLALVCLKHFTGSDSKSPHSKRSTTNSLDDSEIANYASEYVFQHIANIHPSVHDDEFFRALASFFRSRNVLWWIERAAKRSDMQSVFMAGKTISTMVQERVQRSPQLYIHKEIYLLEQWSIDLVNLVTKFGRRIHDTPSAIYQLVPPFCPPQSAIRQQFGASYRGIAVQGLSAAGWDDCLSTITFSRPARPSCVAVSSRYVAVGVSTGKIHVYSHDTFQEHEELSHGEPVWCLQFSTAGIFLGSAGSKSIIVWNTESWTKVYSFTVPSLCLAMLFSDDEVILYGALRNNHLLCWDLSEGKLQEDPINWNMDIEDETGEISYRQPAIASFCQQMSLLAIVYRQEELILWDLENERIYDVYQQEIGSRARYGGYYVSDGSSGAESIGRLPPRTSIYGLAFSLAADSALLAVTYADGDLYVYDIEEGNVVTMLPNIFAQVLSSSQDGRTLATADAKGGIRLYDFVTLKLLYSIQFDSNAPGAKLLAFTSDSLRLVEVRGRQCRIWGPSVLLRLDADDELGGSVSNSTAPLELDYNITEAPQITSVCCAWSSAAVFCGREDGSVYVYDIAGEPQSQHLYTRRSGCAVLTLHYDDDSGLISSGDAFSRVVCRKVSVMPKTRPISWMVSEVLFDMRLAAAVTQIIGSGRQSRLLISTVEEDSLWELSEKFEGKMPIATMAKEPTTLKSIRWSTHPTHPDHLLSIQGRTVQIYQWSTLALLAVLNIADMESLSINRVISRGKQDFLITIAESVLYDSAAQSSRQRKVQAWNPEDMVPSKASQLRPICTLDASEIRLEQVIGVFNSRLIFLDDDYWISSAAIESPLKDLSSVPELMRGQQLVPPRSPILATSQSTTNLIAKHFFLPHDWINLAMKSDIDMSSAGDIFFIKRSEVAIVKRSLTLTGHTNSNLRRASSPGFKLPMRPPLRPTTNAYSV
jgi:WD40 repeat protein